MLEALILTACVSTAEACNPGLRAYYAGQPTLRQFVKRTRKVTLKYFGEWATYGAPVLALAVGSTPPQIKLYGPLSLRIRDQSTTLNFDLEF